MISLAEAHRKEPLFERIFDYGLIESQQIREFIKQYIFSLEQVIDDWVKLEFVTINRPIEVGLYKYNYEGLRNMLIFALENKRVVLDMFDKVKVESDFATREERECADTMPTRIREEGLEPQLKLADDQIKIKNKLIEEYRGRDEQLRGHVKYLRESILSWRDSRDTLLEENAQLKADNAEQIEQIEQIDKGRKK